jgi:hypothetical protein
MNALASDGIPLITSIIKPPFDDTPGNDCEDFGVFTQQISYIYYLFLNDL